MKLNLDYKRGDENEEEKKISNQEVTVNYILSAVNSSHPQGLDLTNRRIFARIQRKIDEALDNNFDDIVLEKAEIDLIKESFKTAKFPAGYSKYVVLLEEEIEKADKEATVKN